MSIVLTPAQLSVIFNDSDNDLYVQAHAGTGKTTTLLYYAEEHFQKKILYVVYNKDMRKAFRKRFPTNVDVHTINSLAYHHTKDYFQNKTIIQNLSTNFLIQNIDHLAKIYKENKQKGIQLAVETIQNLNIFLNSTYTYEQLSYDTIHDFLVKTIYHKMISEPGFPIIQNAILKYFADNFDHTKLNYDVVLVDEAQDINPPFLKILKKIKAQKIFVGDTKQSIYGFRNTINIFKHTKDPVILNNSFRFGETISTFISKVTSKAYNEKYTINGLNPVKGEIITDAELDTQKAYITRTNAHLFDKAFEAVSSGKKVSIPFNWEEVKTLLYDIFYLKIGLPNKTKYLKFYPSYEDLQNVAKLGGEPELRFLIDIIQKYHTKIPEYIKKLEYNLSSPRYADIVFVTAHKAKGLEFDNVEIADDFKPYEYRTDIQEKNLIYVAITRAIEKLKLNKDLAEKLEA